MSRKTTNRRKVESMKLKRNDVMNWKPHPNATDALQKILGADSTIVGCWFEEARCLTCLVAVEEGIWHLSISTPKRYPTWDEIFQARYKFIPDAIRMSMDLPPKEEYVNNHKFCFHLWEQRPSLLPPFEVLVGPEDWPEIDMNKK